MLHPLVTPIILILVKIICLLIAIAYYTIAERKVLAAIQRRQGPNVTGVWGLLQPLADGLKLLSKEMVIPSHSNSRIFVMSPVIILTIGLLTWGVMPFGLYDTSSSLSDTAITEQLFCFSLVSNFWNKVVFIGFSFLAASARFVFSERTGINNYLRFAVHKFAKSICMRVARAGIFLCAVFASTLPPTLYTYDYICETSDIADVHYGLLFILALSSLTVYALITAGWSSNSKYAFLGALRSAAQMISYEVAISLNILPVIEMSGSLNFTKIIFSQVEYGWFTSSLGPVSIIFYISMIAETNRTPFDLPEAEAELVAGYNVEYSSIIFAMFFLAEYSSMTLMSQIKTSIFWGGWDADFTKKISQVCRLVFKSLLFCFSFILIRATFPRYRYDQLMDIGWKVFLPVATGFLVYSSGVIVGFGVVPAAYELNTVNYIETIF